jgi:tRNA dimethylallyltransferase
MSHGIPKIVIVGGPTGSGKTAFSIEIAKRLGAEIVNADSMQVYRGMDIGTAKPTVDERRGIPHHLLDVVNPDEDFNAALYRTKAVPVIREICARGKVGIVVGGTGLYIRGLMGGLLTCPSENSEVREKLRKEAQESGSETLYNRLSVIDPEAAGEIHPNDLLRIIRALEIFTLSKRRPSELAKEHAFRQRDLLALMICLFMEREELYKRLDKRSEDMVSDGLKEETELLLEKGYSTELKPMKAIGYRHMIAHLRNGVSMQDTLDLMKRDTRRYAKRQMTWFRSEASAVWMSSGDISRAFEIIEPFLMNGN